MQGAIRRYLLLAQVNEDRTREIHSYMQTCITVIVLVLLTGCSSCGPRHTEDTHKVAVALELSTYVNEFMTEIEKRNLFQDIQNEYNELKYIRLGDTEDENAVGMCYIGYLSRWILIDPSYGGSPNMMRTLIFHELGHCLLNLEHYPADITIDIPEKSDIMNPYLPLLSEKEWVPMVDKMFGRFHSDQQSRD